jgi:hypothetical protein
MALDQAPTTVHSSDLDRVAAETFDHLDGRMVLASPLGVGKPVRLVNSLYDHARDHPGTRLTIVTALTLDGTTPSSELGRRLAGPIVRRLSGGGPRPAWKPAQRNGTLPSNVEVRDFYLTPGRSVDSPQAQQSHISANYHHVAGLLAEMGTNALAQLVSPPRDGLVSLGTNPDVSLRLLDYLERIRVDGEPVATLAETATEMPRLGGPALVDANRFDVVIDQSGATPLFGIPNPAVGRTEAALGCLAASLVRDGGTLQIGIGALGDAVAAGIELRHRDPDRFSGAVRRLADPADHPLIHRVGGTQRFDEGLYVASEMLSDSLVALFESGVVSRRVSMDPVVQAALNSEQHKSRPGVSLLHELAALGAIHDPLTPEDVIRLAAAGIIDSGTSFRDGALDPVSGSLIDPGIGPHLTPVLTRDIDGPAIHAAFAAGSPAFYETLRDLGETIPLEMVDVGFTNTLLGDEQLKRAQRRHARFVNATMQMTCLGEAASDTLPDGRVISGVGGQHDFVTQGHDLEGARSVIVARATRNDGGKIRSNIVWEHPHPTVPRHLRDIVVTEYGIADLRGRTDAETIGAMIGIADSRFQEQLVNKAKAAGKLPVDFTVPTRARGNRPERIDDALADDPIPRYPFGTVLTEVEDQLRQALTLVADIGPHPRTWPGWNALRTAPGDPPDRFLPHLRRLGLEDPKNWKERLMAAATVAALEESGVVDE